MRIFGCDGTSTVVIFIPAGFDLFLFHPSTHIAPRLNKLTVPSPSPIFYSIEYLGYDDQRLNKQNASKPKTVPSDWSCDPYIRGRYNWVCAAAGLEGTRWSHNLNPPRV